MCKIICFLQVFTKARAAAPAILFLDEVDAVVRKRSTDGSSGVEARILSTLLNEIDGVGISSNVYGTLHSNRWVHVANFVLPTFGNFVATALFRVVRTSF